MKIQELSVGDWVAIDGKPIQMSSVYATPLGGVVKYDHHNLSAFIEVIKPIPITAEILEKNGFGRNGEYNEWNIGEWNERPFIGISLDRQSMRVKHLGSDIFVENKVVYVHQLQLALRLAGIEKEIEI